MSIPVSVVLDRGGLGPLDLTPLVDPDLQWSSVIPGGFASCSFSLTGDPRQLIKQVPYLAIVRVIGDSGRVLFEGQIEDLSQSISRDSASLKVGAYGLQNSLKECRITGIYEKRDLEWSNALLLPGTKIVTITCDAAVNVALGQYDPANLSTSGVQFTPTGASLQNLHGAYAEWLLPIGVNVQTWLGSINIAGTDAGTTKWRANFASFQSGAWANLGSVTGSGVQTFSWSPSAPVALAVGAFNGSGSAITPAADDALSFYDMRVLGILASEDVSGGFYGGTLIQSLLPYAELSAGVVEDGSDFTIDHLDASVTRYVYDMLVEVAGYYKREWAVWEDALLHWTTPNLSQHEWIVGIRDLDSLDLDASVVNSKKTVVLNYVDAASGLDARATAISTDRRNPYVLNGRVKDVISDAGFPMTSNTAAQLAQVILQDLGFGPVPASGTIRILGDKIVQHAQGNAAKAWEIRAGDNITIPELPLADVFTQDGRGENLFHIVSAEANTNDGTVTFSLDSFGSKRSDVLMARLAAVTRSLGG